MKNLILSFIFLIGLFAFSCTAPPDRQQRSDQPTEFTQVISIDQVMQADYQFIANPVASPSPDTPATEQMATKNILSASADVNLIRFEALSFKKPPSINVSLRDPDNQLLTFYIPDKSNKEGNINNRDKLTQMGLAPNTI
jgi:hypothetical protein